EAAAADVRSVVEPEDRPVLEAALRLRRDRLREPLGDRVTRRRPVVVEEPRDGWISPERHGEIHVLRAPDPEAEAVSRQEVRGGPPAIMPPDPPCVISPVDPPAPASGRPPRAACRPPLPPVPPPR